MLLVAARSDYARFTPGELDNRVAQLTWEHTARLFQNYKGSNDICRFLVQELCAFLKEEKLMDQELTPVHHLALAHYGEAVTSLLAVCDIASRWVAENWNTPIEPTNWRSGNRVPHDRWEAHYPFPAGMPRPRLGRVGMGVVGVQ